MPKFLSCCVCGKRTNNSYRRTVQEGTLKRVSEFTNRPIEINSVICSKCRLACFRQTLPTSEQHHDDSEMSQENTALATANKSCLKSPKSISIQGLSSTPKGHSRCVICRKPHGHRNDLVIVPTNAQTQAFIDGVNGRIKHFKLLDKVVPNLLIPCIGNFASIACALCNAFRPPIGNQDPATGEIAEKMLERSRESNKLLLYLTEHDLLKKKRVFKKLEVTDLQEFPRIDLNVIREITLGVYQLKQAPHYTKEHLDEAGNYELMVCTESEGLVQIQIQSRHTSSIKYNLWIKFLSSSEEPIQGWYCTCKVGARVVGCCAHIASVIWYLGWKRWQENPLIKTRDVWTVFRRCWRSSMR